MNVRILIAFSLLSIQSYAQQKVSQIFSTHKEQCDSIMRLYYGDHLFGNYFHLDTSLSFIVHDKQHYYWRDSATIDTSYAYTISYLFHYPGSRRTYTNVYVFSSNAYVFSSDSTSIILRNNQPKPTSGRCESKDSTVLESLAQKELKHPLTECFVQLVNNSDFDQATRSKMDSTHVYFQVAYSTSHTPFYNGYTTKITIWSIVVDGCTGEVIRRNKKRYRVHAHW